MAARRALGATASGKAPAAIAIGALAAAAAMLVAACQGAPQAPDALAHRELSLVATHELDGPKRPSGLAFADGRLLVVGDRSAAVHVVTADGQAIDEIRIALPKGESKGIEGLAVYGDTLYLALEPTGEIVVARSADGVVAGRHEVPGALDADNGLEGLSLGHDGAGLIAAKEEDPSSLYLLGFDGSVRYQTPIIGLPDVSGVVPFCDGEVLALSQEGGAIYRVSEDGRPLESWAVPARAAEGIAFDRVGRVYVVDEETEQLLVYEVTPPCEPAPR